jgi:hypothetical protein
MLILAIAIMLTSLLGGMISAGLICARRRRIGVHRPWPLFDRKPQRAHDSARRHSLRRPLLARRHPGRQFLCHNPVGDELAEAGAPASLIDARAAVAAERRRCEQWIDRGAREPARAPDIADRKTIRSPGAADAAIKAKCWSSVLEDGGRGLRRIRLSQVSDYSAVSLHRFLSSLLTLRWSKPDSNLQSRRERDGRRERPRGRPSSSRETTCA